AAVDVEVGEDAKEPGPEIRARCERPPAPERSCICLLDKILCLLARADESPRNPVHLVGERERLFLEARTVASLARDPPRLGLGARLAHRRTVPLRCNGVWNDLVRGAIPAPLRSPGTLSARGLRRSRRATSSPRPIPVKPHP